MRCLSLSTKVSDSPDYPVCCLHGAVCSFHQRWLIPPPSTQSYIGREVCFSYDYYYVFATDEILSDAHNADVAFLVVGDPLG